jgi:hypothetical protein
MNEHERRYTLALLVTCECGAKRGEACRSANLRPGTAHASRVNSGARWFRQYGEKNV